MRKQKGITLIALVITIIVIFILAGVVIQTLTGDNSILSKTAEAEFKNEIKQYEEELKLKIANEEIDTLGNRENLINVFKVFPSTGEENSNFETEMKTYIQSFNNSKYGSKLEIRNDELIYTDEGNEQERKWFGEVNLSLSKYFITVNYVDKEGNKLAESETLSTINGQYKVEPKLIEGYEAEKLTYEGKIKEDSQVNVEYLPESIELVFIGLDENGNETEDESQIVAYAVGNNKNFNQENVIIPRKYNNKPVTQIKKYAFQNNKIIKMASVPETIQKNEGYIFQGCTNLEYLRVNVENSTDAYNPNTYYAASIKHLELGKNVKSIGLQTYQYSKNLIDITVHSDNITRLFARSFAGCSNLKEIKLSSNNMGYKVEDGVLYSKDGKKLIFYPNGKTDEDFKILDTVEEICDSASSENNFLKRIEVSNKIKKISNWAFSNCNNLEYLNLDIETVRGDYIFKSTSLKKVDIRENVKTTAGAIFGTCTNLTDVTIYTEQANISAYNFLNCSALKSIKTKENHSKYTENNGLLYSKNGKIIYACPPGIEGELEIPDGVETLYGESFQTSYPNITKITLPISIKSVNMAYFSPLENIYYLGTTEQWNNVAMNKTNSKLKTVTCTDGIVNL